MPTSTQDLPATPQAEATPASGLRRRPIVVAVILTGIIVATLAMVSFIWYRWQGVREPTSAVFVEGDETLDGTLITVTGMGRSITTTISPKNGYVASVLLEPGIYRVTAERYGQLLLRRDVEVKRFVGPRFDLAKYVKTAIAEGRLPPLADPPPPPPKDEFNEPASPLPLENP